MLADFRWGVPDLGAFPMPDWLWAVREAARRMPVAELDYGDPRGSAVLREVVAGYARRVRAAAADPEHIVICSGYAQGLSLTLAALARGGVRRVAYEDPGSPASVRAAAAAAESRGSAAPRATCTGAAERAISAAIGAAPRLAAAWS